MRDGKTYCVFPYLRDGQLVNAKTRNVGDKKDMRQEAGAEPCLFGWHLIDPKTCWRRPKTEPFLRVVPTEN